jgi:hypothetical protein
MDINIRVIHEANRADRSSTRSALRGPQERPADAELQVVHISTVFGYGPAFLTTAVFSSDQHYSLQDFVYFEKIQRPLLTER